MYVDVLEGLNPAQREAVEAVDGPLLILAGPGSGKTRVITHRIAYLVVKCGVHPRSIAAVTFTNKAAREMRDRLFGRSESDKSSPLLGDLWNMRGDFTVATFHALCAQILRREADYAGLDRSFVIYDQEDQLQLLQEAMEQLEYDAKRFPPRSILAAISAAKSQLVEADYYSPGVNSPVERVIGHVYRRYQELLHSNNAVDFDDLLLKTHALFRDNPDVLEKYRSRFEYLLIDEFQDTNVAQYAIARQLAGKHRNICVVGDPDQAIYSWRNADIRNILSFERDYPDARKVTLEENYRSTETILEAASRRHFRQQPAYRQDADDSERQGDAVVRGRGVQPGRGGTADAPGDREAEAGGGPRPGRLRRDVPRQRPVTRVRGSVPAVRHSVQAHRRAALLPAQGDQGRCRLSAGRPQPLRRGEPEADHQRPATGHWAEDRRPACTHGPYAQRASLHRRAAYGGGGRRRRAAQPGPCAGSCTSSTPLWSTLAALRSRSLSTP